MPPPRRLVPPSHKAIRCRHRMLSHSACSGWTPQAPPHFVSSPRFLDSTSPAPTIKTPSNTMVPSSRSLPPPSTDRSWKYNRDVTYIYCHEYISLPAPRTLKKSHRSSAASGFCSSFPAPYLDSPHRLQTSRRSRLLCTYLALPIFYFTAKVRVSVKLRSVRTPAN
jgi:hypothetical protein